MTTTLVALAVVMAVVIGWLLRQTLGTRPWAEPRTMAANDPSVAGLPLPPIKIGLAVFMTVATSLFALSISAYLMRREGADWRPVAQPLVLWFNTAMLGLGSACFQWATRSARTGNAEGVRRGLLAGGACTLLFLAGQYGAWRSLEAAGYYVTTNPAAAFFYFLTALHAVHLLGGLWVWGTTLARVRRGAAVRDIRLSVELCTAYWHFLLAVWLVLFGLLLFT